MSKPDVGYRDGCGYEKYSHRGQNARQKRPAHRKVQPARHDQPRKPILSFEEQVCIAQDRIVGATRRRTFMGRIVAETVKGAVNFLQRYVDNHDGKCGRQHKLGDVLRAAFIRLLKAGIFIQQDGYFELQAL